MSVPETHFADAQAAVEAVNRVLVRALLALGAAGETDQACRLAAGAWSQLRHDYPREAERLNGAMHALTRVPKKDSAAS